MIYTAGLVVVDFHALELLRVIPLVDTVWADAMLVRDDLPKLKT